jgi:hypothetical protein
MLTIRHIHAATIAAIVALALPPAVANAAGDQSRAAAQKCPASQELVRVLRYDDLPTSVHIELARARSGQKLEPIDVTKPYHSGYEKAKFPVGALICHPLPAAPIEGQ